jgi:hypothetical protein
MNSNGSELKLQGKKVCSAFVTEGSKNSSHLLLFWNLWEEKELLGKFSCPGDERQNMSAYLS